MVELLSNARDVCLMGVIFIVASLGIRQPGYIESMHDHAPFLQCPLIILADTSKSNVNTRSKLNEGFLEHIPRVLFSLSFIVAALHIYT